MEPRWAALLLILFLAVGHGTSPARADETDASNRAEVPTIVGSVHQFSSDGLSVEVVSEGATWDPEWGRSFRTVRVCDDTGQIVYRAVLPVDGAPDFSYQVIGTDEGPPLAVVYSRSVLYVLDPVAATLSPPIHPLSEDEIIGVDAISGGLVHLTFSAGGRRLLGAVIDGGCFLLDLSDPANPVRLRYAEFQNRDGYGQPLPCEDILRNGTAASKRPAGP